MDYKLDTEKIMEYKLYLVMSYQKYSLGKQNLLLLYPMFLLLIMYENPSLSKSISPPRIDPPSRKVKSGGSDTLCGAELLIDDSVEVLLENSNSRRVGGNGNW